MLDKNVDPHICDLGPILAQSETHEKTGLQIILIQDMRSMFPFCVATSRSTESYGCHCEVLVQERSRELESSAASFMEACRSLSLGIHPAPN